MIQPHAKETSRRSHIVLPLLLGVLFLSLFATIAVGVWQKTLFVETDAAFRDVLHAHAAASPATTSVVAGVTHVASEWSLWAEFGAAVLILAAARKWRWTVVWTLAFGGYFLAKLLKVVIDRPRPKFLDPLPGMVQQSAAFPSGHAVGACVIFGMLAYFIAKSRSTLRLGAVVFAAWLILLIGFSRVYLGAHWFSDVVGGIAFGLGWMFICMAASEALHRPDKCVPPLQGDYRCN